MKASLRAPIERGEKEGAEGRGLQLSFFGAQTILTVPELVSKEHTTET